MSAWKISHLLQASLADCFTALKDALISVHQLMDMQHMEALFNMENMGEQAAHGPVVQDA